MSLFGCHQWGWNVLALTCVPRGVTNTRLSRRKERGSRWTRPCVVPGLGSIQSWGRRVWLRVAPSGMTGSALSWWCSRVPVGRPLAVKVNPK